MTNREFVRALRLAIRRPSIDGIVASVSDPPGRRRVPEEKRRAEWFNSLGELERSYIASIVAVAVDTAISGVLSVIDGVVVVEDTEKKGRLELWHIKEEETLLNPTDDAGLNDIYNDPSQAM